MLLRRQRERRLHAWPRHRHISDISHKSAAMSVSYADAPAHAGAAADDNMLRSPVATQLRL